MKTHVACLFALVAMSLASLAEAQTTCLSKASRLNDPGSRDRAKIQCLRKTPKAPLEACLKVARGMEYSSSSDTAKSVCLFEKASKLKASECVRVARLMIYGENRDQMLWGCTTQLAANLSRKECRALAKAFVYPYNQKRAHSYCENEITISP